MKIKAILLKTYPYVFSALILYLLIIQVEKYDFFDNLSQISWRAIIIVLLFYALIKILNVLRYGKVYGIKDFKKLFSILTFCNFVLNILPFRIGEISYVKYIKSYFKINTLEVVNKLVMIRFFDYVVVYLLLFFSSFYVSKEFKGEIVQYVSLFLFISLFLLGFLILLIYLSRNSVFWKKFSYSKKVLSYIYLLRKDFFNFGKANFFLLFINSIFYWILRVFNSYLVLNILGIEIGFWLVIFISLALLLLGLLPIKTTAGFGLFEGGWSYFLVALGYQYEIVLPAIINMHLLILLPVIFFGFWGWIFVFFKKR